MADEGNKDTFEYTIAGRTMVFHKTGRAQLMMLQRMVRQIQQRMLAVNDDPEKVGELLSELNDMAFEAAESRFTDPLDLQFVRTEVLRGNVEESEIFAILSNGVKRAMADDDADPVPVKRTKKAAVPKKAPANRRGPR